MEKKYIDVKISCIKSPTKEMESLCEFALKSGASRAKVIECEKVVVDERVQLKCRYPPCMNYGKNIMCPPYTPSAKEFREILGRYEFAMVVQMDLPIPEFAKSIMKKDGARLSKIVNDEESTSINNEFTNDWKKIHALVSNVERESFNKGYYLSLGLVTGSCRLCNTCDTKSPCKHPFEARPSMEAMGIDVYKTAKNADLGFEWNNKKCIINNGLILID